MAESPVEPEVQDPGIVEVEDPVEPDLGHVWEEEEEEGPMDPDLSCFDHMDGNDTSFPVDAAPARSKTLLRPRPARFRTIRLRVACLKLSLARR